MLKSVFQENAEKVCQLCRTKPASDTFMAVDLNGLPSFMMGPARYASDSYARVRAAVPHNDHLFELWLGRACDRPQLPPPIAWKEEGASWERTAADGRLQKHQEVLPNDRRLPT